MTLAEVTTQYRFERCFTRAFTAHYAYVNDVFVGIVQRDDRVVGRDKWMSDKVWDRRFRTREDAADAMLAKKGGRS